MSFLTFGKFVVQYIPVRTNATSRVGITQNPCECFARTNFGVETEKVYGIFKAKVNEL